MNKHTNKHPKLSLRYAEGLGDLIACTLHSKALGWLTKLLTGKDKPCMTCSKRISAFNYIWPIPVWKLFFQDKKTFQDSLKAELDIFSPGWNKNNNDLSNYTCIQTINHHYDTHLFQIEIYYKNEPVFLPVDALRLPLDISHLQEFKNTYLHKTEIEENFIFLKNCNFYEGDFCFKINYYILKEEAYGNYNLNNSTGQQPTTS